MANLVNCLIARINILRKKVENNDDEIEVLQRKLKKSEETINELKNKVTMLCSQQASLMQNQNNLIEMQNTLELLNMDETSEFIQKIQLMLNTFIGENGNPLMFDIVLQNNNNDEEGGGG